MGLALEVGILADLHINDSEGFEYFVQQFAAVNEALRADNLPEHHEPLDVQPWSCGMWGYGGLQYLRRVAAYLWAGRGLPSPGDDNAAADSVLQECYALMHPQDALSAYTHLLWHSDAEGFYLPLPFRDVLYPDESLGIAGGMIGSAPMLLEECRRLAAALELPPHLDPESKDVLKAAENQGRAAGRGPAWKRYGIESFTCLQLLRACAVSLETRAAVVFG